MTYPKHLLRLAIAGLYLSLTSSFTQAAPIHDAVLLQDTAEVRSLINSGADVNALDFYGFSPLLLARLTDQTSIARLLNEAGAESQLNAVTLEAQHRLWGLGYLSDAPDGLLGKRTRDAIRDFQTDQGLVANGRISVEFMRRLDELALMRLQTQLQSLGLYSSEVDGMFGSMTREAISSAKTAYNIDNQRVLSAELFEAVSKATQNYPISRPQTTNPAANPATVAENNTSSTDTEVAENSDLPVSRNFYYRGAGFIDLAWF